MDSLAYVIEVDEACDVPALREALTRPVYGATLLERNLRLLRQHFPVIEVVLLIRAGMREGIESALQQLLAAGKVRLQIDTGGGEAGAAAPSGEGDAHTEGLLSADALLIQRGMRLLERLDSSNRTYHCVADPQGALQHGSGAPLFERALQMREVFAPAGNFCYLFQAQRSCEALETGVHCISISEVPGHDFSASGAPLVVQLLSLLHARAGKRSMDGPVSRLLLRNFSQHLSRPLSRWGVHPNVATLAAAACALVAILLFTLDSRPSLIAGGLMWMIGGLLDEVDGELARLQGKESEFGAWLDLAFDRILDGLVLIALAWPVVVAHPRPHLLALIAIAITLVATNSYIGLLYDAWMKNVLGRTVYFRIGRDSRNLVIFLCAVFSFRLEAIWIAGGFSLVEILRRLAVCYRMGPAASSTIKLRA